jgi:hypothetical protein
MELLQRGLKFYFWARTLCRFADQHVFEIFGLDSGVIGCGRSGSYHSCLCWKDQG